MGELIWDKVRVRKPWVGDGPCVHTSSSSSPSSPPTGYSAPVEDTRPRDVQKRGRPESFLRQNTGVPEEGLQNAFSLSRGLRTRGGGGGHAWRRRCLKGRAPRRPTTTSPTEPGLSTSTLVSRQGSNGPTFRVKREKDCTLGPVSER